jgi:hypothetical protein
LCDESTNLERRENAERVGYGSAEMSSDIIDMIGPKTEHVEDSTFRLGQVAGEHRPRRIAGGHSVLFEHVSQAEGGFGPTLDEVIAAGGEGTRNGPGCAVESSRDAAALPVDVP